MVFPAKPKLNSKINEFVYNAVFLHPERTSTLSRHIKFIIVNGNFTALLRVVFTYIIVLGFQQIDKIRPYPTINAFLIIPFVSAGL